MAAPAQQKMPLLQPTLQFQRNQQFQTSLFGCSPCLYGCLCPLCLASENSRKLDNAEQCLFCCYPANPCKNRLQAKAMMGIQTNCFTDTCIAMLCGVCSECQIYTEYEKRKAAGQVLVPPSYPQRKGGQFSASLCSCNPFCKGCCCLCCLISDNSAQLDAAEQCMGCCYPGGMLKNRLQAKAQMGVETSCFTDCLIVACFGACSECQIATELQRRMQHNASVVPMVQNINVLLVQTEASPNQQRMQ